MPLLRRLFQFSCPDDRGRERVVPYPSMARLIRERIPRPVRTTLRILSWRFLAVLALMSTIPLLGALVSGALLRHTAFVPPPPLRVVNGVVYISPPPPIHIWPFIAAQAGTLVLMMAAMAALMILCQPALAARYKREMLRLPRCPWCLYDLAGSPVQDGLRTCPECGGGWVR